MTLAEALAEGIQVTIIGLVIVFSVLVILMLVMMAMKKVFYKEDAPKAQTPAAPAPAPQKVSEPEPAEDPNLIAVLAAAVAASLNTSTYNLNIKSYRRIENNSPAWSKEGLRDVIDSRF